MIRREREREREEKTYNSVHGSEAAELEFVVAVRAAEAGRVEDHAL